MKAVPRVGPGPVLCRFSVAVSALRFGLRPKHHSGSRHLAITRVSAQSVARRCCYARPSALGKQHPDFLWLTRSKVHSWRSNTWVLNDTGFQIDVARQPRPVQDVHSVSPDAPNFRVVKLAFWSFFSNPFFALRRICRQCQPAQSVTTPWRARSADARRDHKPPTPPADPGCSLHQT